MPEPNEPEYVKVDLNDPKQAQLFRLMVRKYEILQQQKLLRIELEALEIDLRQRVQSLLDDPA